jgi:cell division initiation protein
MPTPETPTPGPRQRAFRLTPDAVRRREFTRSPLGRRGYLESDVDRFRTLVADEIAYSDAEKAELRAEVDRLRNYFRDHHIDPGLADTGGSNTSGSRGNGSRSDRSQLPSVQVVNMMSMAQQAADQHIAQAENYAREMVGDARKQYEEILLKAQARAEEAAAEATRAFEMAQAMGERTSDSAELESKIAYLRTFAEVTQVQMRSILQALGEELDRLSVHGTNGTGQAHRETVRIPAHQRI